MRLSNRSLNITIVLSAFVAIGAMLCFNCCVEEKETQPLLRDEIIYSSQSKYGSSKRREGKFEVDEETTTPPVHLRKWVSLKGDNQAQNSNDTIRVLQYNILADVYTTVERYNYCPREALSWEYRKTNLLNEILLYDADIITLQEVDKFDWFDEKLQERGYLGVYKRRPAGTLDGLAVFYKQNKFDLINASSIDFNTIDVPDKSSMWKQMRYTKNNIGLFCQFQFKNSRLPFVVATTHTYWDPKLSDLKVRQSHMLLTELERYLKNKAAPKTPVIITGDFNSMPDSGVYQLYLNGFLPGNHKDMLNFTSRHDFKHNFKLKSAYSHLNEPLSNLTPWFKGTLDYIWHNDESFETTDVLDMVPHDIIEREVGVIGLPSPSFSSDHIALCANLKLKNQIRNLAES